jgi:hypothetical protein
VTACHGAPEPLLNRTLATDWQRAGPQ